MKNRIIAILVGAIIVFVYQAVSWMFLPTHANSFKYTASEDAVLTALSSGIPEEGMYMLPGRPPGMSHEEFEEKCKARKDQPVAIVEFHNKADMNMGKAAAMGFITIILAVAVVVWMLTRARPNLPTYGSIVLATLMFGVFVALYCHMSEIVWMEKPMHHVSGELIDDILAWLLCGLWLGYWLRRDTVVVATPNTTTAV